MSRAHIFIGSSSEGLPIAEAMQSLLDHQCEVTVWSQGVFGISESYLESLLKMLDKVDFAILVLTPDDITVSRNTESKAPRDNVLFELGLFMGQLGRQRCYFVYDRTKELKIPTDLLGISAATFRPHSSGNFEPALGAAKTKIFKAIEKIGLRPKLLGAGTLQRTDGNLPDISGPWKGFSPDSEAPNNSNSTLQIEQYAAFIRARVERVAKNSMRVFDYEGVFTSGQLVLFFEEEKGRGFIVGSLVLYLSGDLKTLVGRSTYYNHTEKKVVSTARRYARISDP